MWNFVEQYLRSNSNSTIRGVGNNIVSYTFGEVIEIIKTHGEILKSAVIPGSKCAILCKSEINVAFSMLACWYANLIPIPMSQNYGSQKNCDILSLTTPEVVIIDDINYTDYDAEFVYDFSEKTFLKKHTASYVCDQELVGVSLIMCTSGTTGNPKGVMITTEGLINNVLSIDKYFKITNKDTILIVRPLYHCAVISGEFLISIIKGTNIVFLEGQYNPIKVIKYSKVCETTVLCATPTLFNQIAMILESKKERLNIEKLVISGECLSMIVANRIRKNFPDSTIYHVYGLTEASPRVSYLPPEQFDSYPESVGIALYNTKIKITSDSDKGEIKFPNIPGDIWVHSISLFKGYYKNTELTNAVLKDGWLNTGDVGFWDENSNLYILSRKDDMIIKGGMNIYPQEIKKQVMRIKQIDECNVYGIKSIDGEKIVVDIVLNSLFSNITLKELSKLISKVLPAYQLPNEINIVESIEKTVSGKIKKHT